MDIAMIDDEWTREMRGRKTHTQKPDESERKAEWFIEKEERQSVTWKEEIS
jgi:hypothetical protein